MGRARKYSQVMTEQLPPFRVTPEIYDELMVAKSKKSILENQRLSTAEIVRRAIAKLETAGKTQIKSQTPDYGKYGNFTQTVGATFAKAEHIQLVRSLSLELNLAESEVMRRALLNYLGQS